MSRIKDVLYLDVIIKNETACRVQLLYAVCAPLPGLMQHKGGACCHASLAACCPTEGH